MSIRVKIVNAAKKYADSLMSSGQDEHECAQKDFVAGAEFSVKELLPSEMVALTKWLQWEKIHLGTDKQWYFNGSFTKKVFAKTDKELLEKYQEYLNKKENDELKGFFDNISF